MSNKKKEPIGFRTPAMRIQEEYGALRKQLSQKKADWADIFKHYSKSFDKGWRYGEQRIKFFEKNPSFENRVEMEHVIMANGETLILLTVSRIGMELGECNERLANVEKELKDLRQVK